MNYKKNGRLIRNKNSLFTLENKNMLLKIKNEEEWQSKILDIFAGRGQIALLNK